MTTLRTNAGQFPRGFDVMGSGGHDDVDLLAPETLANGTRPLQVLSPSALTDPPPEDEPTPAPDPTHAQYLASVIHDLRNPLSLIGLEAVHLANLLGPGHVAAREAVSRIAQNAAFARRIVADLLDAAVAAAGHLVLRCEPTDLAALAAAVVDRAVADRDRPRILLELAPAIANVDPLRIERVVENLVQNAIKYAPGTTPIAIRVEAGSAVVRVSVTDRGPGLDPAARATVFDPFRRVRATQHREGVGLGLYVGRTIVEAHGGRIGVDSVVGEGATFYFELPALAAGAAPRGAGARLARADLARLRGLHVLVVDDEIDQAVALGDVLAEEGLVVSVATTAAEAMAVVQTGCPDVVVIDVGIPALGGGELLACLRRCAPDLAAVLLTGYELDDPRVADAIAAHGCGYVAKPVDVDRLFAVLAAALDPAARRGRVGP